MAAHVTEIYQPSRSPLPGDPLDVDDSDLASHRLPRLIVGALLGLAALTTLVWFGYEQSVGRTGSEMVVIEPPPGPVRTRPDDAGGETQLYAGLKVYEQPQRADIEAQSSRLSPARSSDAAIARAKPPSGAASTPANAAAKDTAVLPEYLQIGSYPTPELAESAFRRFQGEHGDLAGVFLPDIKKADLGEKGVWYRLRIGPFAGMTVAAEACEKMKKEGVTCLITAR